MTIADDLLPNYQFAERHGVYVEAPAEFIFQAIDGLTDDDDPIIRALIIVREAPARWAARLGFSSATAKSAPRFGMGHFTKLARSESEIVYGLIGRFWRPNFGLENISDAAAFQSFERAGVAKLVMSFRIAPSHLAGCDLTTETHIFCPDRRSLLIFTLYWWIIRAASGWIRRRMLIAIKTKAERDFRL
jgi:hypothetical protein